MGGDGTACKSHLCAHDMPPPIGLIRTAVPVTEIAGDGSSATALQLSTEHIAGLHACGQQGGGGGDYGHCHRVVLDSCSDLDCD